MASLCAATCTGCAEKQEWRRSVSGPLLGFVRGRDDASRLSLLDESQSRRFGCMGKKYQRFDWGLDVGATHIGLAATSNSSATEREV